MVVKVNKLVLLLSMAAMGVSVAQAAAPTAELKVKGVISPGSCTVNAPDNGEYDYGRINAGVLKQSVITTLASEGKKWDISCDADTALTFKVVDNRLSSVNTGELNDFGLGHVNGTGVIGSYKVSMVEGKVDGVSRLVFRTNNTTITGTVAEPLTSGSTHGWVDSSSGSPKVAVGKMYQTTLFVKPSLASIDDMNGPVTSDVNLDGSLTLNFAYGI